MQLLQSHFTCGSPRCPRCPRLYRGQRQTPSPPRGAVPVNLGRTWEALSFWSFRIEFGYGCDRPAMSAVFMPKRGLAVHLHKESDGLNRFSAITAKPNGIDGIVLWVRGGGHETRP